MYIRLPALKTLLLIITVSGFSTTLKANEPDCFLQNDQLAKLKTAKSSLETHLQEWIVLSETCLHAPYVFHNIAVIYGKLNQWDNAASYFKLALEKHPEANQSHQQLNSIYRYQAVLAYHDALQSNNPKPKKPSFSFQASTPDDFKADEHGKENQSREMLESTVTSIVENWIEQNNSHFDEADPEFLLVLDSSAPIAVIHTDQRSVVLELHYDQGLWQLSKERSIP